MDFISHMVQMKGRVVFELPEEERLLYIPHGSDESFHKFSDIVKMIKLYIPHGSDESFWCGSY